MKAHVRSESLHLSTAILLAAAFVGTTLPARAAEPTTGECLAATNDATDLRHDLKLRKARARALVCASASCPADIRKDCLRRVDELGAVIPSVLFVAKDAAGADVSAVKVTMDGEVLAERLDGTALAIDPGEHNFVFETAGEPPLQKKYVIRESEKQRRELIDFATPCPAGTARASGSRTCAAVKTQLPLPEPDNAKDTKAETSGLGTQKLLGIVAAGAGIVGLGVGTAFGVMTLSQKSQQESDCASATSCGNYAQAANDHSAGMTDSTIATVGFIAGGALLVGGAVLFFTARPASSSAAKSGMVLVPSLGKSSGGLVLQGTF